MNRTVISAIEAAGAPFGLNLVGATSTEKYDARVTLAYRASAIAPGARSIIVIGNGGGAMWRALTRHAETNPGWMERANPLDDFTRLIIERDIAPLVAGRAADPPIVYPFMGDGATLNFIEAAKSAGVGAPSILGVAIHPRFGPWIAFRAALMIRDELDLPADAAGFDPCPQCVSRDCMSACPVSAISPTSGWDVPRCLTYRVESEHDCAGGCHARINCVFGRDQVYPADELRYHQMRAMRAMRPWYDANIAGRRKS
jgi:epoxyqueuosine reductase QueG